MIWSVIYEFYFEFVIILWLWSACFGMDYVIAKISDSGTWSWYGSSNGLYELFGLFLLCSIFNLSLISSLSLLSTSASSSLVYAIIMDLGMGSYSRLVWLRFFMISTLSFVFFAPTDLVRGSIGLFHILCVPYGRPIRL